MGQGANQVRRDEPIRLRDGESVVLRPDAPAGARYDENRGDDRAAGRAVAAGMVPSGGRADEGEYGRPSDDPAAIEAEIERTRNEMSGTIDAIQQRLSPENLKEEAKETAVDLAEHAKQAAREAVQHAVHEAKVHAREAIQDARYAVRDATIGRVEQMARTVSETTEDTRYGIMETIKQNPIPAALTGIGLAWLLLNRQSAPPRARRGSYLDDRGYGESRVYRDREYDRYGDYRYERDRYAAGYGAPYGYTGAATGMASYEQRQDESSGLATRAQEKLGQAGDAIGDAADRVGERVGTMAEQAGERASTLAGQAQEATGQLMDQAQHRARYVEDRVGRAMHDSPLAVGAVALALGAAIGLAVPETRKEHELFGSARDNLMDQAQDFAQEAMEKVQGIATEAGHTVQREAQAQGLTS